MLEKKNDHKIIDSSNTKGEGSTLPGTLPRCRGLKLPGTHIIVGSGSEGVVEAPKKRGRP
jgi:hypothetical protein